MSQAKINLLLAQGSHRVTSMTATQQQRLQPPSSGTHGGKRAGSGRKSRFFNSSNFNRQSTDSLNSTINENISSGNSFLEF